MMLLIGVLPLALATVISYENSKQSMEKEILRQNTTKMEWVSNEIRDNVDRIDEALTAFFFDDSFKFYLNKVGKESNLKSLGVSYFKEKIRSYYLANYRDFDAVSFYAIEEKLAYHLDYEEFNAEMLTEGFMRDNPILSSQDSVYFHPDSKGRIEPYVKKFYQRFEDQKKLGVLVVKLKWDLFQNTIELLNIEKGNAIYVVKENGELILGAYTNKPNSETLESLLKKIKEKDPEVTYFLSEGQYVFFAQVTDQVYVIKTIPQSVVSESYRATLNTQLFLILLTGVLVVLITIFLGLSVTKPITRLARSMQSIDGYVDGTLEHPQSVVKSNDEIKILEQSYLLMLQKIDQLINQEYKQKIELQSAQLMALQAQINPHFMYNTLQMMGAMAIEKESPEIYSVISAFSNMMRYNMRITEDLVTIEEELDNLENYIQIQQLRFERKLNMVYEIDSNLKAYRIPKLTLQPIVENCYKHGFSKKLQEWHIIVRIQSADDEISIMISDNGKGIRKNRLLQIQDGLEKSTSHLVSGSENLGVKNIDSRLKLHFGKNYGLVIESVEDQGVKVSMRLPKIMA